MTTLKAATMKFIVLAVISFVVTLYPITAFFAG